MELLERGELPYHRVGTHRRVFFHDLAAYGKKRDQARRESLSALAGAVDEAGFYDASYTQESPAAS